MYLSKAIYTSFTGISPTIAESICYAAKFDSSIPANVLEHGNQNLIWIQFYELMNKIKKGEFTPVIYEKDDLPVDFSAVRLSTHSDCNEIIYDDMSSLLRNYYAKKNLHTRMRQKSSDLRRVVTNALEKDRKKFAIQEKEV